MTLNSKVLSLVLLSGLTMGGTFAKKQKLNSTDWTNESQTVKWSEDKCDSNQCPDCTAILPTACPCPELKNCALPLDFKAKAANDLVVIDAGSTSAQVVTALNKSETVTNATLDATFDCALNKVCFRIVACGSDAKNLKRLVIASPEPNQTLVQAKYVDLQLPTPVLDATGFTASWNLSFDQGQWLKTNANNVTSPVSALNYLPSLWTAFSDGSAQFGLYLAGKTTPEVQGTILPCSGDDSSGC